MGLKSVFKRTINNFGYQLLRKDHYDILLPSANLGYEHESVARQHIESVRSKTMVAYSSLVSLWQQARHCEIHQIDGDYVECGVWKGGAVGLMALANMFYSPTRRTLHLFDAFDDICEPDIEVDGDKAIEEIERHTGRKRDSLTGKLEAVSGFYEPFGGPGDLNQVKRFLESEIGYSSECCQYHKGWFQDTLPISNIDKIAILRLDSDWYASTKICLDTLYEKVVPGGFIILDDYGCYEGCKKAVDEFLSNRNLNVFLSHINTDCRFWQKQ